jgi:branched-subunit amino acid transport protein
MTEVWVVIAVVAVGSFLSRAAFFYAPRSGPPSESGYVWLTMVPPAAFAALVAPAVLTPDGDFRLVSAEVLGAVVAAAVAWRTRSIAATILVGLAAFMLLGLVPALA